MQSGGFSTIDLIISVTYIFGIISVGIYFSRQQKSAKDFLMAGRSMGWLPVGLSLMATLTSAVGYMAYPAGAFKGGLILLWMAMSIPLSLPLIVYVFMPFYHRLKLVTAYEYLERRFNHRVRALASFIFIVWRITWMAAVIYVPSMVFDVVSGGRIPLVPSIIVMGIIATVKTALGGVKAVMWGDVFHSFVMFIGLFVALGLIVAAVPGGLPEIWNTLVVGGKTKMTGNMPGFEAAGLIEKIRLYLVTDFTVVSLIITYTVQKMGNYCVDQAMVQRYITAKSLKESQKGFYANAVSYLLYIFLATAIGAGLYAVAQHLQFPTGMKADNYFPYFIANLMPVGVVGLMVAAIWAASLSSLDGGINSITTAILNDFYARYSLKQHNLEIGENSNEEKTRRLRISRISTVVIGILVTFFAFFVGMMGDIFAYSQTLINMFTGPLFGVFILGMYSKRATSTGVLIGGLVGFIVGSLMAFSKNLNLSYFAVGALWPAALSFFITMVIGYVFSFLWGKNTEENLQFTKEMVMKNGDMAELVTGEKVEQLEVS